jgi:hydrogenase expression/formation protein HypC
MCLGIPGKIIAISDAAKNIGVVDVSGISRAVELTCVANGPLDDLIGQWVLVHVGFAMSVIDEDEAQKTLAALAQMQELEGELAAIAASKAMTEISA